MNHNKITQRFVCFSTVMSALIWHSALQAQQPDWNPERPDPAYSVNRVADGAILVHNPTGNSWWLHMETVNGERPRPTWLPISRVEDYGEVVKWLQSNNSHNARLVDVEIAFARAELKEARKNYGTRHPKIIALSQDLRALERFKRASDRKKASAGQVPRTSD
jgi:hypothetical protein